MSGELVACWLMVTLATASIALSFARGARPSVVMVVADVVMLVAMVDVCLLGLHRVSPVLWATGILALTLVASASVRFSRRESRNGAPGHDVGHPLAMIIGAGLLLFMGAGGHDMAGAVGGSHAHGASATAVVGVLVVCATAHLVVVALRAPGFAHSGARVEGARRLAVSAATAAMAGMAVVSMSTGMAI